MQRGYGTLAYLIAGAVLVGMLTSAVMWIHGKGYASGAAAKQVEWDQANRKAEAERRARAQDVSDAIKEREAAQALATDRARRADDQWKEARRAAQRNGEALAVCQARPTEPDGSVRAVGAVGGLRAPAAVADAGARGGADHPPLLTWRFVHLYDSAWTGLAGEPLPGAAEGAEGAAGAGAASPYAPGELLDVHQANAERCSADRREYAALIAKLRAAADAFDRRLKR